MIQTKILSKMEIAFGVFKMEFPKVFSFIPGQVISIGLGTVPPRMYSIASGSNENVIRILFDEKPDGQLTPKLSKLNVDDSVMISEPFGNFMCKSDKAFWIASGTGIAPFYSMFRSGLIENKDITVIHGGRFTSSFYFQNEFIEKLQSKYIRCCSQEQGAGLYPGRLTIYLHELLNIPGNHLYYLCGSAEMVVDTRDVLISKGIPFENISSEIYF